MATIAVISDIHANLVALDTVLRDLDALRPDHVVCLGDVAATGPDPRGVLARLRERDWQFVMGNCDDKLLRYAAHAAGSPADEHDEIDRWCAAQLDVRDIDLLRSFLPVVRLDAGGATVCFYHGSPRSNLDEILPDTPNEQLVTWFSGEPAAAYAGGHTHVAMVRRYQDGLVFNPGSVGLPFTITEGRERHPAWAEYGVLTLDLGLVAVELRRIPIDIARSREVAAERGMPGLAWWSGD
jgi:predicted phosphodiesterase